jgi:phosphatidylglycerophosphate synthase
VIREAVLYLPAHEDARAALLPVAGRAVAARVVMAAVRGGIQRVRLPAVLRTSEFVRALGALSPGATTSWLDQDSRPPDGPVLLVPATGLAPVIAFARMRTTEAPAVLAESRDEGAPLVTADPALARTLWDPILAGGALAGALDRELKARAVGWMRGGTWHARVTDPAAAARAEARLLEDLGTAFDTRLDLLLHRRLARPLTRTAVHLGVTPNQLTLLSLLLGLGAAWSLRTASVEHALVALGLYAAAVVLDHADGEVARLTFTESTLGEWLDVVADTVVHAALVVAMGVSAAEASGRGVAVLGMAAAAGIVLSAALTKVVPPPEGGGLRDLLVRLGNRDGFYAALVAFILLLAFAPSLLPILLIVVTVGSHAYWVARLACLATPR